MTIPNEQEQIPESERQAAAVMKMPFPYMTVALLVCIAAVFAVQEYVGLDRSLRLAGFDKLAFTFDDQYWRLFTGFVLHGFLVHILMNGYALYIFGRQMEMLSNKAHLANVILISAIAGNILSLIFLPNGLSIGISGGVVGLIGYLAVYSFRRRQFISAKYRKSLLINIGFILLFGIALYNYIDNYGHIGGLVAGAIYGFIQIPSDEYTDPREAGDLVEISGYLSLGLIAATSVFSICKMFLLF